MAFASLAVLIAAMLPAVTFATDGVSFKSKDGRLSIWVPIAPSVTERSLPSTTGAPYRQTTFAAEAYPALYLAGILDFRNDLSTNGDEVSYLDSMLGRMKAGFGSSFVIDKTDGTRDLLLRTGQKGRQIRATAQGQRVIIRAYVGKYSIYMQQVGFPVGNEVALKSAERFLDSLVINEQAQP